MIHEKYGCIGSYSSVEYKFPAILRSYLDLTLKH